MSAPHDGARGGKRKTYTPDPTCLPCGNKIPGFADALAQARAEGREDVIGGLRIAATHPHKGPNDTDASMLREAAKRAAGGYTVGGSNTQATTARVLRLVAEVLDSVVADDLLRAAAQAGEVRRDG